MKFHDLPEELLANITERCTINTALNVSNTCQKFSRVVNRYQLAKIKAQTIEFEYESYHYMDVTVCGCSKLGNQDFYGVNRFKRSIGLNDHDCHAEPIPARTTLWQPRAHVKFKEIMDWVKSVEQIKFSKFSIDQVLIRFLREHAIDWKKVSVVFYECNYDMPKEDLLPFWRMFKSVQEIDGHYIEPLNIVIDDEMISQTLPNINIIYEFKEERELVTYSNLTDRTLELLTEVMPRRFMMGRLTGKYTVRGLKNLCKKVIEARDPRIDFWCLGSTELDWDDFNRIQEEFLEFHTHHTTIHIHRHLVLKYDNYVIKYTYANGLGFGRLSFFALHPVDEEDMEQEEIDNE